MGPFEFFSWPVVLPLCLPWVLPRREALRGVAKKSFLLLAIFVFYLAFVAAISPQNPTTTRFADMRYTLPVVLFGAAITSASLMILWRTSRPVAIFLALLLAATNLLFPGSRKSHPRHLDDGSFLVRSTLYDYVREALRPYQSSNAALIAYLENLPADTKVLASPLHLSYPGMVYAPHLIYCEQLYAEADIRKDLKDSLPEDVFRARSNPDVVLIIPELGTVGSLTDIIEIPHYRPGVPPRNFRFGGWIQTHVPDMTRPEIPLRLFQAPPEKYRQKGIAVYFPVGAAPGAPE